MPGMRWWVLTALIMLLIWCNLQASAAYSGSQLAVWASLLLGELSALAIWMTLSRNWLPLRLAFVALLLVVLSKLDGRMWQPNMFGELVPMLLYIVAPLWVLRWVLSRRRSQASDGGADFAPLQYRLGDLLLAITVIAFCFGVIRVWYRYVRMAPDLSVFPCLSGIALASTWTILFARSLPIPAALLSLTTVVAMAVMLWIGMPLDLIAIIIVIYTSVTCGCLAMMRFWRVPLAIPSQMAAIASQTANGGRSKAGGTEKQP